MRKMIDVYVKFNGIEFFVAFCPFVYWILFDTPKYYFVCKLCDPFSLYGFEIPKKLHHF